jgi:hypothetical protein
MLLLEVREIGLTIVLLAFAISGVALYGLMLVSSDLTHE